MPSSGAHRHRPTDPVTSLGFTMATPPDDDKAVSQIVPGLLVAPTAHPDVRINDHQPARAAMADSALRTQISR
jgi:hypothetical protein